MNNATSATTGKSPNKVVYSFKFYSIVDLVSPLKVLGLAIYTRIEVYNAVAFANIFIKTFYDRKYHSIYLRVGDYAYIKLYKGYEILITRMLSRKLF